MLLLNTMSGSKPSKVVFESLPTGKRVLLSSNIRAMVDDDGCNLYAYDEVIFHMPHDRNETVKSVEDNFDAWWEFGQQENDLLPTLEQRVTDLEDLVLSLF